MSRMRRPAALPFAAFPPYFAAYAASAALWSASPAAPVSTWTSPPSHFTPSSSFSSFTISRNVSRARTSFMPPTADIADFATPGSGCLKSLIRNGRLPRWTSASIESMALHMNAASVAFASRLASMRSPAAAGRARWSPRAMAATALMSRLRFVSSFAISATTVGCCTFARSKTACAFLSMSFPLNDALNAVIAAFASAFEATAGSGAGAGLAGSSARAGRARSAANATPATDRARAERPRKVRAMDDPPETTATDILCCGGSPASGAGPRPGAVTG